MFSCEFCQISKNTFFTTHLWATASVLHERRLKQIEISIISKITKKIMKKEKFLRFLFFTCCTRPFTFQASLFTKRPCFIIFILSFCSNMLSFCSNHPGMKYLHVYFSLFHPRMKFHLGKKRVNSKIHFIID